MKNFTIFKWMLVIILILGVSWIALSCDWFNKSDDDNGITSPSGCGGESFAGYCWYLGGFGESCATVCSSHGGYHTATKSFVGSHGSATNCSNVLNTLNAPQSTFGGMHTDPNSTAGCSVEIDGEEVIRWWGQLETDPDAAYNYLLRACACNQ